MNPTAKFSAARRVEWVGTVQSGAGGASKAFAYADGRRIAEIERVIGVRPLPGSLNVRLSAPFDWDGAPYTRAQILDVVDRSKGLDSEWAPRWGRFYALSVDGIPCWAFRFEGERYPLNFIELIAPVRLRDHIRGDRVTVGVRE